MKELSVIQKTCDLIKYYVPIIERFPKVHKFTVGDRIINQLYDLLEGLIKAKYANKKLNYLINLNVQLDILRHQTKLLLDFQLIALKRYKYISQQIDEIGIELGGNLYPQIIEFENIYLAARKFRIKDDFLERKSRF